MTTDLLDERVRSVRAEQQDGSAQRVSVAVQLLGPHGGEEVGEDFTDVPVHSLQGHVHALTGRLVQEALQATNVWRNGKRRAEKEFSVVLLRERREEECRGLEMQHNIIITDYRLQRRVHTGSGFHDKHKHMTQQQFEIFKRSTL